MNDYQRKIFEENNDVDFSIEFGEMARFRVNVFCQQRGLGAVFRKIPTKILTMEDAYPLAEAVLIQNGRIKGVGKAEDLQQWMNAETEQVDLCGKTLIPAFIDAHSHLAAMANGLLQVRV